MARWPPSTRSSLLTCRGRRTTAPPTTCPGPRSRPRSCPRPPAPRRCAYRDALAQAEFATREHIPFPLLSDPELRLAEALRLATFEVAETRLYRRLTLVAEGGSVVKAFYPVFPPDRDAATVLGWLRARAGS